MPLVDPFIPTRPRQRPTAQLVRSTPASKTATPRAVSQQRPSPAAQQPQAKPEATSKVLPLARRTFTAPQVRTSRLKSNLQLLAIMGWAVIFGLGSYSQLAGEIAIFIYAIVALSFRLSSRTTFALALCAFGGVVVLQVIRPDSDMGANFTIYAFLLLMVGCLSLGAEARERTKWGRHRQQSRTREGQK